MGVMGILHATVDEMEYGIMRTSNPRIAQAPYGLRVLCFMGYERDGYSVYGGGWNGMRDKANIKSPYCAGSIRATGVVFLWVMSVVGILHATVDGMEWNGMRDNANIKSPYCAGSIRATGVVFLWGMGVMGILCTAVYGMVYGIM